jgi:hypothetical protein
MSSHRRAAAFVALATLTVCLGGDAPGRAAQDPKPKVAPPLDAKLLAAIRDDQPFGKPPSLEVDAFYQAMQFGAETPLAAFEASGTANKAITIAQLLDDPAAHRGKVVTVQGTLRRLLPRPAAPALQKHGITVVYDGVIDLQQPGLAPVAIAFPNRPVGVPEGNYLEVQVRFSGYFFKRFPYKAEDKREHRTVLLVGPTVTANPFWLDRDRAAAGAAAQVVGARSPLASIAMVQGGGEYSVWPAPGQARPLAAHRLPAVRDDDQLIVDVGGQPAERIGKLLQDEYAVLCEALANAWNGDARDFDASAARHPDLTSNDLVKDPAKHRGKVVSVNGWVKSIRRIDPPRLALGVQDVYEVWLALDRDGGRPVCVLLPRLNKGLEDQQQFGQEVQVSGYFLKLRQFMGKDGPVAAPLLVAPNVVLLAVPEVAPALDVNLLKSVRHDRPLADLRNKDPKDVGKAPFEELKAYNEAVVKASRTPLKAFEASAAANKNLTLGHLLKQPVTNCGKVVTFEGVLRRVTREDAPRDLHARGVPVLYEGWISLEDAEQSLICVVFTDLPKDVTVGDNLKYRVRFTGYYFKRFPYEINNQKYRTVLLIGPTVTVLAAPPQPGIDFGAAIGGPLLGGILGLVAVTLLLIVVMAFWFRRGDQAVKRSLRKYESSRFADEGDRLQGIGEGAVAESVPPGEPPRPPGDPAPPAAEPPPPAV